jgi:hypothetical protein
MSAFEVLKAYNSAEQLFGIRSLARKLVMYVVVIWQLLGKYQGDQVFAVVVFVGGAKRWQNLQCMYACITQIVGTCGCVADGGWGVSPTGESFRFVRACVQ